MAVESPAAPAVANTTLNAANLATPASTPAPTPTPAETTPAAPVVPAWNPTDHEEYVRLKVGREQAEADIRKREEEAQQKLVDAARKEGNAEKLATLLEERTKQDTARIQREADAKIEAEKTKLRDSEAQRQRDIADRDNRIAATEARQRKFVLDKELGLALSSHHLMDGAAAKVLNLVKDDFVVEATGDSFVVKTANGQTPTEYLAAYLQANPYFVKAQNPGGGTGGVQPGQQSAPGATGQPATPVVPKNLGEGIILQMQEMQAAQKAQGGDSRTNISLPMGLTRKAN